MTDLFVSAAAALMMILAISRPTPDIPLPIQADMFGTCPEASTILTEAGDRPALSVTRATQPGTVDPVLVPTPEDLWTLPARLGLQPRLFYTIALIEGPAPVTAACADWALNQLVRTANTKADISGTGKPTSPPPIFGLELATRHEARR